MIRYERGGLSFLLRVFQRKGSVFGTSFRIALPCATMTLALKLLSDMRYIPFLNGPGSILTDNGVWSGFSFLVGFLIVFRTSQAYARFWDGCTSTHLMRAEWYDACSAIIAFCRHSKVDPETVLVFQHTVVRLFSMLHALALAEIEDSNSYDVKEIKAFRYELIDAESIDPESMRYIRDSDSKVELVYQWIQHLLVDNIGTGILSIPAPLLSRVFQEVNSGMIQFHEAIKISTIPFPFPYAQTCDCLLIMHYLTVPIVLSQWVSHSVWAFIFAFTQVSILWSLNCIAVEIENPFGQDDNDIDAASMQAEMNRHLTILLSPASQRTSRIECKKIEPFAYSDDGSKDSNDSFRGARRSSFNDIWQTLEVNARRRASGGSDNSANSASTVRSFRSRRGGTPSYARSVSFISTTSRANSSQVPRRMGSGVVGRDKVCLAPCSPLHRRPPQGDLEPEPPLESISLHSRTASSRLSSSHSSRGRPCGNSSLASRQNYSSAIQPSSWSAKLGDASASVEGGDSVPIMIQCTAEAEDDRPVLVKVPELMEHALEVEGGGSELVKAAVVAAPQSARLAEQRHHAIKV